MKKIQQLKMKNFLNFVNKEKKSNQWKKIEKQEQLLNQQQTSSLTLRENLENDFSLK
jgi:hypothetical protein